MGKPRQLGWAGRIPSMQRRSPGVQGLPGRTTPNACHSASPPKPEATASLGTSSRIPSPVGVLWAIPESVGGGLKPASNKGRWFMGILTPGGPAGLPATQVGCLPSERSPGLWGWSQSLGCRAKAVCVPERPGKGKDLVPEGQALSPHEVSNLVAGAGAGAGAGTPAPSS